MGESFSKLSLHSVTRVMTCHDSPCYNTQTVLYYNVIFSHNLSCAIQDIAVPRGPSIPEPFEKCFACLRILIVAALLSGCITALVLPTSWQLNIGSQGAGTM